MERKTAEGLAAGIIALIVMFVVNHFVALAEIALTPDVSGQLAYAQEMLWKSFLPGSETFFVLGTSESALAAGALGALVVMSIWLIHVFKGHFRNGEEHGSARFATASEVRKFADQGIPTNNVILSKDFLMQAHGNIDFEHRRNRNVLVIGGSGAGKTFGYIKPNLMQIPAKENATKDCSVEDMEHEARSFFVTDSKGTSSVDTGLMFATHGYTIKMFNTIDFASSMHFNPFRYINKRVDCMSFATCLVRNTTGSQDPNREDFWEKAEMLFFNFVGVYMLEELVDEDRNMDTFCRIVDLAMVDDAGDTSPLDVLMKELEEGTEYTASGTAETPKDKTSEQDVWAGAKKQDQSPWKQVRAPQPNHPAVLAYKDFLSGAKETKQSILISVKTRLTPLRVDVVQDLLSYDELELEKIGERKTAMYCVFDGQDPTYNFLIAIMVWLMFKQLFTRCATVYAYTNGGELPVGVDFLLDEAANFYIPDLEKTIAQCRSMNIGISLLLQSKGQLKKRYGDDADTIIDCCDSLVFLGGKSTETNKMLEEMIGEETVSTESSSENTAQSGVGKQLSMHGRALLQSPEIAKMSRLECLVLVAGCNPWKGDKANPEKLPLARYVNPGRHGSKFKRGFDFLAYQSNHKYYLYDTSMTTQVSVTSMQTNSLAQAALFEVRYRVDFENKGEAPVYDLTFTAEIAITCTTNESAREKGHPIPFPDFETHRKNGIWYIGDAYTSKDIFTPAAKHRLLHILDSHGQYSFSGVNVSGHGKMFIEIAFEISMYDVLTTFSCADLDSCEFEFQFKPSIHAANADVSVQGKTNYVTFTEGGRRVRLS